MKKVLIKPFIYNKKTAFTLAEILITLVILGIIAVITIPNIIKTNQTRINKTRVKKGMSNYEKLVSQIMTENNLYSNGQIDLFASNNNCINTRAYFKSTKNGKTNCRFKTSDGLWWDITDLRSTTVAFKEDDLTNGTAELRRTDKAFKFISGFQGTIFMSNSLYYNESKSNIIATSNLLEYLFGDTSRLMSYNIENLSACTGSTAYRKMATDQNCYDASGRHIYIYSADGNMIRQYYDCPQNPKISDYSKCATVFEYVYDQNLGAHTDPNYEKNTNAGKDYAEYYSMIQYDNTGKMKNNNVYKCVRYFCSVLRSGCDTSGRNCKKCYNESELFIGGGQGQSVEVPCN